MHVHRVLCFIFTLFLAGVCWAGENTEQSPGAADKQAGTEANSDNTPKEPEFKPLTDPNETPKQRTDRYWYLIAGVANVWPRLSESKHEIDRDINGLYGNLLPNWEEPATFSDWRDQFMLWDLHLGVGRSLNEKWSVFSTVGFIMGTVRTYNDYLANLLDVNVKFHRKVQFISAGVDYYPWGKSSFDDVEGDGWLLNRIRAGKPYLEGGIGYVHIYTVGQVIMELPVLNDFAKVKHAEYYDLIYLSPRIGYDIPVSENGTLSLTAGYLFFDRHGAEFNTASYYVLYKHRL